MTRSEEVAKMIQDKFLEGGKSLTDRIVEVLCSLPEFQPGRELTGEEIQRIFNESTESRYGLSFDWIAAELNKIRAPKTGVNLSLVVKQLNDDLRVMTKERAELQSQLEALKSKPVGVTKEQVRAALIESGAVSESTLLSNPNRSDSILQKIADALSPKWIKCSDRMPEQDQSMWCWIPGNNCVFHGHYGGEGCLPKDAWWKPVSLPEPPEEEESKLVKDLNRLWYEAKFSYDEVMKAVKEFEKGVA